MKRMVFIIILFLSMITHSMAEVTQWTDDKGIVHFKFNSSEIKKDDEVSTALQTKSGENILQIGKTNFTKTLGKDNLSLDQAKAALDIYNETIETVYESKREALLATGLKKKALDLQLALLKREQYKMQLSALQEYKNTINRVHAANVSKRKAKEKRLNDLGKKAQELRERIQADIDKLEKK